MAKRKKRKVRLMRLIVCLLAFVVIVGACIAGFCIWNEKRHQQQMRQTVDEYAAYVLDERSKVEQIENIARNEESMDEAAFEAMKASALNALDPAPIQALQEKEKLNAEEINAAIDSKGSEQDQQCLYLLTNMEKYSPEILEFYMTDSDRYEFVKAYPDRLQYQTPPEALDESLESVPHLLQWDLRWGYQPYGDYLVYFNGCAPTCLSMVFSYLKQDPTITPASMKNWSDAYGYYVNGAGTSHELLTATPESFGISVEGVEVSREAISQALAQNKVLVFNMTPGNFTQTGHFIVVDGEENGLLRVKDPNSIKRTERRWSYEEVLPETAAIWAYSLPAEQ